MPPTTVEIQELPARFAEVCAAAAAGSEVVVTQNSVRAARLMPMEPSAPLYPWRLDTNERYREVVKAVMALATASLILPVFYLRDVLRVPSNQPLSTALSWPVFASWAALALSVASGVIFQFASAKWVRLAWGQPAGFFGWPSNDRIVEAVLHATFWVAVMAFVLGIALILWFVVTVQPHP